MPQLPFPDHIAHKPVYALPYYGHDPEGAEDPQYLTVGWSQWDPNEPAVKILRHSGQRWSRQSEEIPIARLVDAVTLLALVYQDDESKLDLVPGFLENQPNPVKIKRKSDKARNNLASTLHRDPKIRRRFSKLADVLLELRQDRQI